MGRVDLDLCVKSAIARSYLPLLMYAKPRRQITRMWSNA